MKLVDEIQLEGVAGDGGNGVERWHRNRMHPKGGPAGGDGGKGGDVRIRAVRDISLLGKYRSKTLFQAKNGESGGKSSLHGADGEDVIIDLPIGSIVHIPSKDHTHELLSEGEEFVIFKGGAGGYGNEHFKSSRNVRPTETTDGKPGERGVINVELKLIADLGLVGYPNAGKSSLLNAITNAKAKVGNYAFTTLDPNLGELFGYIIADIPGIIENASEGKGLGYKFLKHITRTKALIFCISAEQDDPISAFTALIDELGKYDKTLAEKPFIIALTKVDILSKDEVTTLITNLHSVTEKVYPVTIHDESTLKAFRDEVVAFLRAL